MSYSIFWEPKGVYCKFFGTVSLHDIQEMASVVVADSRFDKLQYRITDCLDVTLPLVSAEDIDTLVAMNDAYSFANARKYEGAVATDDVILSLLRYWASTSPRQHQLCIFSSVADVRKWLIRPNLL